MINKTFSGGITYSGAKVTIDYLLNERVEEGKARLLIGDTDLTLSCIKYISKKNKWNWSSGVLSFAETLDDKVKLEIIEEWRKTFFCGLSDNQYNDLWVNHEDKKRTELHYIVPRLELTTGLSYNPYFVTRDFHKKDLFQEFINLKYNLSSFKDNQKLTSRYDNKYINGEIPNIKKYIDKNIISLIKEGVICNRNDLIDQMREWEYELYSLGKESISFLHRDVVNKKGELLPITMKGKQYGESYTDWENLKRKVQKDSQTVGRGIERNISAIRVELDEIIKQQAITNKKRYEKKRKKSFDEEINKGSENSIEVEFNKIHKDKIWGNNTRREYGKKKIIKRNIKDDRLRSEINRRVTERESVQRRIAEAVNRRDEYSNERIEKRLSRNSRAIDNRIKRKSIRENRREERRTERHNIIFKTNEYTDEYDHQIIERRLRERKRKKVFTNIIRKITNSINPLIERVERGFDYRNQKIKQELDRSNKSILKKLKEIEKKRVLNEFEKFKTVINLAEFATTFGYSKDIVKSKKNALIMTNEKAEDRIIIGICKENNHYIYFNSSKNSDNGTIIDFVKNRTNETLLEIRERLKLWSNNHNKTKNIVVKASSKNAISIASYWDNIEEADHCFSKNWDLSSRVNSELAKLAHVKFDTDEKFYFMLSNEDGICGVEMRTNDTKYLIEGSEEGIFTAGKLTDADRIFIFESPIDMISHKALNKHQIFDFRVCIVGESIEQGIEKSLRDIFEQGKDKKIIVAVDNDNNGEYITNKIKDIIYNLDGNLDRVKRELPKQKNWNDDLKMKRKSEKMKIKRMSPR